MAQLRTGSTVGGNLISVVGHTHAISSLSGTLSASQLDLSGTYVWTGSHTFSNVQRFNGRVVVGNDAEGNHPPLVVGKGDGYDKGLSIRGAGSTDWRIYADANATLKIGGNNAALYVPFWEGSWSGTHAHIFRSPSKTASSVVVAVRGAASQTGNLQEWQDSSQVIKASVSPNGLVSALGFAGDGSTLTGITAGQVGAASLNGATFTGLTAFQRNGIATTPTDGIVVENGTLATSGVPFQYSPRIRLRSHSWKSTAPTGSRTSDWTIDSTPTDSGGFLRLGVSANGGAYSYPFVFDSGGRLQMTHISATLETGTVKAYAFEARGSGLTFSGGQAGGSGGDIAISGGDSYDYGGGDVILRGGVDPYGGDGSVVIKSPDGVTPLISANTNGISFFGVATTSRKSATTDIKDALTAYGLLQGTSATPLNLDGGLLTAGSVYTSGITIDYGYSLEFAGTGYTIRGAPGTPLTFTASLSKFTGTINASAFAGIDAIEDYGNGTGFTIRGGNGWSSSSFFPSATGGDVVIKGGTATGSGTNTVGIVDIQSAANVSRFRANNTGIGFFTAPPVAQQGGTTDLKDALTNYGLFSGTAASPLNLDGGTLTAGTITASGDINMWSGKLRMADGTNNHVIYAVPGVGMTIYDSNGVDLSGGGPVKLGSVNLRAGLGDVSLTGQYDGSAGADGFKIVSRYGNSSVSGQLFFAGSNNGGPATFLDARGNYLTIRNADGTGYGSLNSNVHNVVGGTVTSSTPVINASQTWNASGVAFTGIRLNVTNIASNAASNILSLERGGTGVFTVALNGSFETANDYGKLSFDTQNGVLKLKQYHSDPLELRLSGSNISFWSSGEGVVTSDIGSVGGYFGYPAGGGDVAKTFEWGVGTIGLFGVTPAARQSATTDIKDALTAYGLLQGTATTPLNLDGGLLTAGAVYTSGDITAANTTAPYSSIFVQSAGGIGALFRAYRPDFGLPSLAGRAGFGPDGASGLVIFTNANAASGGSGSLSIRGGGYDIDAEKIYVDSNGTTLKGGVSVVGAMSSNGSISAASFVGDGSQLTGIPQGPAQVETIGVMIDGNGSVISTGAKGLRQMAFGGEIVEWTILATDGSTTGSVTFDVKKASFANYPATTSICGGSFPSMTSSGKVRSTAMSGWTTTFSEGDLFEFVVNGATTLTKAMLVLKVIRT